MKRFEKWNALQDKSDSAEVQAVGMIVAEILDNAIRTDIDQDDEYQESPYNLENRNDVIDSYMKKFTAILLWMNEEEDK